MMDVATVIVTAWLVDAHFFQDPVIHMQSGSLCNLRATIDRRMPEHFLGVQTCVECASTTATWRAMHARIIRS